MTEKLNDWKQKYFGKEVGRISANAELALKSMEHSRGDREKQANPVVP